MCHAVRVKLSAAEKKAVRKFSGILIPVYASVAIVILAVIALNNVPRANEILRSYDAVAAANGTTR